MTKSFLKKFRKLLFLSVLLFVLNHATTAFAAQNTTRILFIGNSYTSAYNIPKIFSDLAAANNVSVEVDALTPGGAKFSGHLVNPLTAQKLAEKNWDYVVLQEQSQLLAFDDWQVRAESIEPGKKLVALVHERAKNAKVIFYNSWGRKNGDQDNCKNLPEICSYDGMQRRLDKNYSTIAIETNSLLVPVGKVWRKSRELYPNIELYEADGSHPSEAGAYLVAYSFYKSLFYYEPSKNLDVTNLDKSTASLIRSVVEQVITLKR